MVSKHKYCIFVGFLIALSSTAIVMRLLSERGEIDSPHGRISIGTLIFQDLCVVPFMLLIPVMSVGGGVFEVMIISGKALAIILIVLLSARWIVPVLLHQVVHTRSRELFVITILILCFGTALLTFKLGLSLALGAFLAGLVISESEYAHQATSEILPFRDSFSGLFFVSVGMLMDLSFFVDNLLLVLSLVAGIILLKTAVSIFSMLLLGSPLRTSIQSSINIAQVGEFSFVLAVAGLASGLISNKTYQIFLSASILTMLLTPFLVQASPFISSRLSSQKLLKRLESIKEASRHEEFPRKKTNHVLIIGFGLNGRNLVRVLREADIPYVILELNIGTVREMKKLGEPIYYGDGTKTDILHRFGVKTARVLAIVISDPASCRNIVQIGRKENPDLFIIARTRYISEVDGLKSLGADEVIPEEFETSIEIFSRVLSHYRTPRNIISEFAEMIRKDSYKILRQPEAPREEHLIEKCIAVPGFEIKPHLISDDS